jgi:hypothetical protein
MTFSLKKNSLVSQIAALNDKKVFLYSLFFETYSKNVVVSIKLFFAFNFLYIKIYVCFIFYLSKKNVLKSLIYSFFIPFTHFFAIK